MSGAAPSSSAAGREMVPADFALGDPVVITFGLFGGTRGTIVGRARRPWRDTWYVALESRRLGFRRLRVAERALRHLPQR